MLELYDQGTITVTLHIAYLLGFGLRRRRTIQRRLFLLDRCSSLHFLNGGTLEPLKPILYGRELVLVVLSCSLGPF